MDHKELLKILIIRIRKKNFGTFHIVINIFTRYITDNISTLSTFIDDIQFYSRAANDENAISIEKYRKVATRSFANEATRENRGKLCSSPISCSRKRKSRAEEVGTASGYNRRGYNDRC